jgi:DNA modification methylase
MPTAEKTTDNSSQQKPQAGGARGAGAGRRVHRKKLTPPAREASDGEAIAAKFPRYRMVKTAELLPYENNPRTHSDAQIAKLIRSIEQFGFTNPILTDGDDGVIAGHGRLLAAQKLGMETVPTIELKHLTPAQRRAYVIADNRLAEDAGWDDDLLRLELGDLRDLGFDLDLTGFDPMEVDKLLGPEGGNTDPDEVPEVPVVATSRVGDVWTLGRHRLVCGDCTDAGVVEAALNGVRPHLMVTDPPYGVGLDPSWRDKAGANTKGKSGDGGEAYMEGGKSDRDARWDATWALSPSDVFYVWCAPGPKQLDVYAALLDAGFETRQFLIWDKGVLTLTRTHYWYQHETCLYGVRKGQTAHWTGEAGQPSVWKIASPKHIMSGSKEKNEPHPAQKPVECMRRPIENNSSPGQAVYDPFVGSGTTIIAAEMTGRACVAIEISPQYCDVALLRWQAFTGQSATLAADGRTYAAIVAERGNASA